MFTLPDMEHIITIGLSKIDISKKKFPIIPFRMINNILSTGIMLNETVMTTCVKISKNEKHSDKTKL